MDKVQKGKLTSMDQLKGMRPNVEQRRPNAPKHSAPKPFKLAIGRRPQGR